MDDDNKEFDEYYEDEDSKRKFPSFILLCLITTFGVLTPLGVSLSVFKYFDSTERINSIISSIKGDDSQKDKYIITYIENSGYVGSDGKTSLRNGSLYISSAKFDNGTEGASGIVKYYGGLMITTKTTFTTPESKVTYKLVITNDSSSTKTFYELLYNQDSNYKYTISGIKEGDKIDANKSVDVYLTVEYTGKDKDNFPKELDTTVVIGLEKEGEGIHIIDAKPSKTNNGGSGEVIYYGGLTLETENKFTNKDSSVTYAVTIKNDSEDPKTYNGLNFNEKGEVKYTVEGINDGDTLAPGEIKVIYVTVTPNGNLDFPTTIDTTVTINYNDFDVNQTSGIYLLNQFPTKDEVGKLFEGKNYVFNFALLLGKKAVGAYYEITAVPNSDNNLNPNYVKIYLEKNKRGVDLSYKENGKIKVFTDYKKSEYEEADGRVIYKGYITEEEVKNKRIDFTLRMWVSEDVKINESNMDSYGNKKFAVKVNTYAMFTEG